MEGGGAVEPKQEEGWKVSRREMTGTKTPAEDSCVLWPRGDGDDDRIERGGRTEARKAARLRWEIIAYQNW